MSSRILLLSLILLWAPIAAAADWALADEDEGRVISSELRYAKRTLSRSSDGARVSAYLAFFSSPRYRLEVIDLGAGRAPAYDSLADAFRAHQCIAGVNGGFFHPDLRPAGLVIASGQRTNRFERAKLLSGVLYSDDKGLHIVRRGGFQDHRGIDALLQSGPYLVEAGRPVRGLSDDRTARRTFVATDWRGHWVMGATLSALTLSELAQCLASPGALADWGVDRALNLDGGSSTGFFFDRGTSEAPVDLPPHKRVRNLLGIVAR